MDNSNAFCDALLGWWDAGHADLPWRRAKDPYAVWVSEVMLQQTQVTTVLPYFQRWMARFPSVSALAAADLDEVLKLWEGLGYYSRARNLHAAAQTVVAEHGGVIPSDVAGLLALKGIGRYTAGAITSIAFDRPEPVVDGNIIRVLSRLYDLSDDVTKTATKKRLWALAAGLVRAYRPGDFNQALMELGQQVCRPAAPACHRCPVAGHCAAFANGTQLNRPVRPPRKKIPHYDVVAGVIWRDPARFLIAQRPLDGLLGGLWEFPGGKLEKGETLAEALMREIQEELVIDIAVSEPVAVVRHAFTHFRITLHAFHARLVGGTPQHIGVANHAWVTLAESESYAYAYTDRQILAALRSQTRQLSLF